jgi:hypothetical protein
MILQNIRTYTVENSYAKDIHSILQLSVLGDIDGFHLLLDQYS